MPSSLPNSLRRLAAPALALGLVLFGLGSAGCEDSVKPCDEYQRFVDVVDDQCPGLAWDCETEYPLLLPEEQQDLDWCVDCVRLQQSGETDRDCREAPLSLTSCGALLDATLDASCFSTL